ncbi:MAG TPA: alpha/beta fold hydrolase [Baekduia sp.]|nr:alpha/beta fold hydrolase [Baekduia sp.]
MWHGDNFMRTRSRPALHVEDRGSGEPVLLITGWTISSAIFEPVLDHYTPHVRCVTYDHRGSGRSAPWPFAVSMAMLAADAARVLDDRGIDAAHVAGASMGGMVALELAVRFPHRVRSLVLMGAGASAPDWTLGHLHAAVVGTGQVARDSARRRGLWPEALLFSEAFRRADPQRAKELTRYFRRHRSPPWMVLSQALAAGCFDRLDDLHRVRAPTLVLHGERDVMVPLSSAHRLAAGILGAELHVVPGAGHAAALEQDEATAELLLDWVRRHAGEPVPAPPGAAGRLVERASRPLALHVGATRAWSRAARRMVRL